MASSSGNSYSSAATPPQTYSGSEPDAQNSSGNLIEQIKRKRMESNWESARRSRMRKQKHLDDLTAQILHLTKENGQILTGINTATQHLVSVEAEKSILRAQVAELSQRLQSLDEILHFICSININSCGGINDGIEVEFSPLNFRGENLLDGPMMSQGDMGYAPRQPIMAAAAGSVFQC